MSNIIQPFSSMPVTENSSAAKPLVSQAAQSIAPASNMAQTDSVTLSNAAQTSTALLSAARGSSGVDQPNVSAIKASLANGSYNVSPEDLAQAISTVLSETPA